jgi:site-specific DNA recombinase
VEQYAVEPREAATVLRIFREFSEGMSESRIVKGLNADGIAGRRKSQRGWSPATVHRILRNEKYVGHWVWNRTETRRDPRTGRRRQFPKPESDWFVQEHPTLRIVPQDLWDDVQARLIEIRKSWPGGRGVRGFADQHGGTARHYPTDLLSGAMICGACGSAMVKVSGKSGGYYGCLAAVKNGCTNRMLVRRALAERVVIVAVRELIMSAENLDYVLARVKEEVENISTEAPETVSLREAECAAEERRLSNLVEFIAEGRSSRALADALRVSEKRVDILRVELDLLKRSREMMLTVPPREWIEERLSRVQPILEQRTARSALLLRQLLGTIRMEPTVPDVGRPYYRARTDLDVLAVLETEPGAEPTEGSNPGSNPLHWWRRRESNPKQCFF